MDPGWNWTDPDPGIYIMQNTMVRGGDGQLGEKIKLGVREKNKKGKEKGGKLH